MHLVILVTRLGSVLSLYGVYATAASTSRGRDFFIGCVVPWDLIVEDYAVSQVAFLAGCLYTAVGIFRLGWLTNFLSHSVISGFMSGASVIIALSQVQRPPGFGLSSAEQSKNSFHPSTIHAFYLYEPNAHPR